MYIFKKILTFVLLGSICLLIVFLIFISTNLVEKMQIIFIIILYLWTRRFYKV